MNKKGFTLVEVLISLGIMAMVYIISMQILSVFTTTSFNVGSRIGNTAEIADGMVFVMEKAKALRLGTGVPVDPTFDSWYYYAWDNPCNSSLLYIRNPQIPERIETREWIFLNTTANQAAVAAWGALAVNVFPADTLMYACNTPVAFNSTSEVKVLEPILYHVTEFYVTYNSVYLPNISPTNNPNCYGIYPIGSAPFIFPGGDALPGLIANYLPRKIIPTGANPADYKDNIIIPTNKKMEVGSLTIKISKRNADGNIITRSGFVDLLYDNFLAGTNTSFPTIGAITMMGGNVGNHGTFLTGDLNINYIYTSNMKVITENEGVFIETCNASTVLGNKWDEYGWLSGGLSVYDFSSNSMRIQGANPNTTGTLNVMFKRDFLHEHSSACGVAGNTYSMFYLYTSIDVNFHSSYTDPMFGVPAFGGNTMGLGIYDMSLANNHVYTIKDNVNGRMIAQYMLSGDGPIGEAPKLTAWFYPDGNPPLVAIRNLPGLDTTVTHNLAIWFGGYSEVYFYFDLEPNAWATFPYSWNAGTVTANYRMSVLLENTVPHGGALCPPGNVVDARVDNLTVARFPVYNMIFPYHYSADDCGGDEGLLNDEGSYIAAARTAPYKIFGMAQFLPRAINANLPRTYFAGDYFAYTKPVPKVDDGASVGFHWLTSPYPNWDPNMYVGTYVTTLAGNQHYDNRHWMMLGNAYRQPDNSPSREIHFFNGECDAMIGDTWQWRMEFVSTQNSGYILSLFDIGAYKGHDNFYGFEKP